MTEQKQRPGPRQAPPWEREADTESVPFGSWLRQQRELREITLREISDATKISLRYLEALEEERFDLLPATLFARGFLRQYARYVGLDPDEAVNRLLIAQRADEPDEPESERTGGLPWAPARSMSSRSAGNWKNVVLIAGVAALLLGLIFLIPWLLDRQSSSDGAEAPPPGVVPTESPEDRVQPPPEPEPETSGAPLVVTLDFREDCWVEATVDGEPRVGEVRVQGESLQLEAEEFVELRLGNAGVVDVEVNGREYDLGAAPGEVKSFRIDAPESESRAESRRSQRSPAAPRPQPQPVPEPSPETGDDAGTGIPPSLRPEPSPEPPSEPPPAETEPAEPPPAA